MLEEQATSFIHSQIENVSIIGGSAGDDIKFESTKVYWDGRFVSDAAVFTIFETTFTLSWSSSPCSCNFSLVIMMVLQWQNLSVSD